MDDAALYIRLRAVCCTSWGLAPPEFDRLAEEGRVAAEDAIEALLLRAGAGFGWDPMAYIFREAAFTRKRKLEVMRGLVAAYRTARDPARRAELERRMKELQG